MIKISICTTENLAHALRGSNTPVTILATSGSPELTSAMQDTTRAIHLDIINPEENLLHALSGRIGRIIFIAPTTELLQKVRQIAIENSFFLMM